MESDESNVEERERTRPWRDRVAFGPGGAFAYAPGEILVRSELADAARRHLGRRAREVDEKSARRIKREEVLDGAFVRFTGVADTLDAVASLHQVGIPAQFNHVLFAIAGCCPPHPASPEAESFYAKPYYAHSLTANPYYAHPYYAHAGAGGCCCCCGGGSPQASPYYAHPYYAHADPSPQVASWAHATGRRRSSARPSDPPKEGPAEEAKALEGGEVRIAILDTGWAESHVPDGLPNILVTPQGGERPDEDGDGFLDPAAGHGTFIAGVIEQMAPGCKLEVIEALTTYGDGKETDIAELLLQLAKRPKKTRPHFVNLSFGGYSPLGMWALAHVVAELRRKGTIVVAAAGNDGTCVPMYPAALPQAIAVGALDDEGDAAPFTNYGPWVDACTAGVDVRSIFFKGFNGAEPPDASGQDDDDFDGWAEWSGTSFAAPRVVAQLARLVQGGAEPEDAVQELVRADGLDWKPMLGTVV